MVNSFVSEGFQKFFFNFESVLLLYLNIVV